MAKKKKDSIEYRYYEIGQDECVLALFGESWIRDYGHDVDGFHFHNLMEVGVCHEGRGDMSYEEGNVPYAPGTITVIPRNLPHVTISEAGKKSFWEYIFFDPAMVAQSIYPDDKVFRRQLVSRLEKKHLTLSKERCPQLFQMMSLLIYEMAHKQKHYKRVTKGLAEAFLMELYRLCVQEKNERWNIEIFKNGGVQIREALEYVGKNYMDAALRIETLAGHCGLSETHFRRVFKEQTHMTPSEYVNLVRIQHACELMRKSSMAMDEVSGSVGFESTSSFTRNFKKLLNITPYQWKKHPENYQSKILEYNVSVLKGW